MRQDPLAQRQRESARGVDGALAVGLERPRRRPLQARRPAQDQVAGGPVTAAGVEAAVGDPVAEPQKRSLLLVAVELHEAVDRRWGARPRFRGSS